MKLELLKMQGAGNDYLFYDAIKNLPPKNPRRLARVLSQRHKGLGADGLVLMLPSDKADARMQMFNADGSEGKMCGNAIRCMGKYLFQTVKDVDILRIETAASVKTLYRHKKGDAVLVNMGKATPIVTKNTGVPCFLRLGGLLAYPISVGNPHLVCFGETENRGLLLTLAEVGKTLSFFPEGVNVEIAKVIAKNQVKVRVFERGSGETLSCGTGAVAVAAVGIKLGILTSSAPISLCFPGGDLVTKIDNSGDFWLGGDTQLVYKGVFDIEDCL